MNYWVIINIFLVIHFGDIHDPGLPQLTKNGFVDILHVEERRIAPGEKKTMNIPFIIRKGYHIQSNQVLDDNLIPTSLTMKSTHEIVLQDAIFPASSTFQFKNSDQVMMVFHDELEVKIPVVAMQNIKNGNYTIKGNLHYQVCDSMKCYFPRDLPFEIEIMVR